MARIRTIKPQFWKHEELSELPADTHLLAAALLNYADDEGYFNANTRLITSECCPLRELAVSVPCSLNDLSRIGYVEIGDGADGKVYGRITKFKAHQRVNRASPSGIAKIEIAWREYPPFTEASMRPHDICTEASRTEGKGREGNSPIQEEQGSSEVVVKYAPESEADKSPQGQVSDDDLLRIPDHLWRGPQRAEGAT